MGYRNYNQNDMQSFESGDVDFLRIKITDEDVELYKSNPWALINWKGWDFFNMISGGSGDLGLMTSGLAHNAHHGWANYDNPSHIIILPE